MDRLTLFDILVILAVSQGIFSFFLLLFKSNHVTRNRLLAFIQLTFVLLSCKILLHTLHLWDTRLFRYFPLAVDLTLQPLIFLYVRASTDASFRFKWKSLYHFIPFVIFFIHALIVYLFVLSVNNPSEKDAIAESFAYNTAKSIEDLLSLISAWTYGILSYVQLRRYQSWLNNHSGNMSYPTYSWLRNLIILFGIIVFILTFNLTIDGLAFNSGRFFHWELFYLAIAVAVYYLGIAGYRQEMLPPDIGSGEASDDVSSTPDENSVRMAAQKIQVSMRDSKLYRDPEITLVKLSKAIGLGTSLLSYTINKEFGVNFRSLVNQYRIEEVKARLRDPQSGHLSILGIALDSGFNSEASFYRVFKNMTGKSPGEFLEGPGEKNNTSQNMD